MNTGTLSSTQIADARITFLGRTYGMLALCIAAGSIGAYASLGLAFPMVHPFLTLFMLIGGVFLVQAVRHTSGINLLALLAFGALTGFAISPLVGLVAAKSGMLVAQAFMSSAVAFVGLTAYTFVSRRDFSFLRGFVWMGLVTVVILGVSNLFFHSATLALALSGISVLLFSAFILYDTSTILRSYPNDEYVAAALTLYLDVFLLFENLLVLFGMMEDD